MVYFTSILESFEPLFPFLSSNTAPFPLTPFQKKKMILPSKKKKDDKNKNDNDDKKIKTKETLKSRKGE